MDTIDTSELAVERAINADQVKVTTVNVFAAPAWRNPYWVLNDSNETIGTANINPVVGGFHVELHLDHHTPERLDLEIDPDRLEIGFALHLDNTVDQTREFIGVVRIKRKG